MRKSYYIYILTNASGTLYIGVTSDLIKRIWEHKHKVVKGFTEKYNIETLIYYEEYADPENAILREKQLKGWLKKKKLALIRKVNPEFKEVVLDM